MPRTISRLATGAQAAPMPDLIHPQLATLADQAPAGERWLHEIKYDGYRLVTYIGGGKVRPLTRKTLDWTYRFPELRESLKALPTKQAILDGEVVSLLPNGASDFERLQTAFREGRTGQLVYYVFDLLYLDGKDWRPAPLEQRKERLAKLLKDAPSRIQFSDFRSAMVLKRSSGASRCGWRASSPSSGIVHTAAAAAPTG